MGHELAQGKKRLLVIKRSKEYTLTPGELELLQQGITNPDFITGYFFKPEGSEEGGFYFDYGFREGKEYQRKLYHASQSNIVVIGGVGTGKTLGIGMAASAMAVVTESFKFLNVAQKEWQAKLMYDLLLEWAEDTPFQKLIWSAPQRPYPKIILRYRIGNRLNQSSLEFMSVDRDARGIFSWRGDWINVEEAGLLDNLEEIALNLSTRLTGSTKNKRPYLGRFSFISNPWENPHLWYLFDLAAADPENNLAIVIGTRDNTNVTEKQVENLLKHIPEDERPRFLEGLRPEGRGNYFSKEAIYQCEDIAQSELIENGVRDGKPGYIIQRLQTTGIYHMETPKIQHRMYFVLGDPGSDNAPGRNAPVLMCWDVTGFPSSPIRLVAFWWGFGQGKIQPFIDQIIDWKDKYNPFLIGVDSTGPQKSMAELVNIHYEDELNLTGLDFSGPRKTTYLVAARLMIEARLVRWPKSIKGIRAQLSNYDPMKDRSGLPKIAQDIVATFSMACFAARTHFGLNYEDLFNPPDLVDVLTPGQGSREARLSRLERTQRSGQRAEIINKIH